jgi:hypothetical protein
MSDNENDEHGKHLSEPVADAAHPFDQTNGVVEGLEGDADDPEQADKKTGDGDGIAFLAAPAPGSQMPGGAIPVKIDPDSDSEDDPDFDDSDPSTP